MPPASPTWRSVALRFLPAAVWMALIYALSDRSTLPQTPGLTPDAQSIAGHFVAYAVLAALLWWGFGAFDLPPSRRFAIAFVCALVYAVSDEWHQSFVPGRDASLFDIAVDTIGALAGLGGVTALERALGNTTGTASSG